MRTLRIAFIHDWLFHMRGGEKCLRDLCELFPDSEIFTLFHNEKASLAPEISARTIHRSFLSRVGVLRNKYKLLLPFYPLAVWHLSSILKRRHAQAPFDLVISVSHCAAKNVSTPERIPHLCYCLTPARYLWDQFDRYVQHPAAKLLAKPIRELLQNWDRRNSRGVNDFVGISHFVAERIKRVYGRNAGVVYPGVDLDPKIPTSQGSGAEFTW